MICLSHRAGPFLTSVHLEYGRLKNADFINRSSLTSLPTNVAPIEFSGVRVQQDVTSLDSTSLNATPLAVA